METSNTIQVSVDSTGSSFYKLIWGFKFIYAGILMLIGIDVEVVQSISRDALIASIEKHRAKKDGV